MGINIRYNNIVELMYEEDIYNTYGYEDYSF